MSELVISSNERLLIVAPHPDDESIGLGGLISRFGTQCDVCVVTDGSKCRSDEKNNDIVSVRKIEFDIAMKSAGVNHCFWMGIEDRSVVNNLGILKDLDLSDYNKVFIPSEDEQHIDHIATNVAALEMLKEYDNKVEIYCYEITNPLRNYTHYLDVTDYINKKKRLIAIYKSQNRIFDYTDAAISLNRFRADMEGFKDSYIEVVKQIDYPDDNPASKLRVENEKFRKLIDTLVKLIYLEKKEGGVSEIICSRGYKVVDIYGYGILGKSICDLIDSSKVQINNIVDKRFTCNDGMFINFSEYNQQSDAVIITVLADVEAIISALKKKGCSSILTVDQLISFSEETIS